MVIYDNLGQSNSILRNSDEKHHWKLIKYTCEKKL